MDKKSAIKVWRETFRDHAGLTVHGGIVHEFAQRVERIVLGNADRRLASQRADILRILRRSVCAMAHAANVSPVYADAYRELESAIEALTRPKS
jgi:hypothetical protein